MKHILVTGGAGYIGSVLTYELIEKGYKVTVIDKGYFGFDSLKNLESFENFSLERKDFADCKTEELGQFDAVCHLAGFSNDPQADFSPKGNSKVNRDDAIEFFNKCVDAQIEKFIFASSAAVYGFEDKKELDETWSPDPKSNYAKSKLQAEAGMWERRDEIQLAILRQGTVMGCSPRQRYDLVVNTMVRDAFDKGIVNIYGGGEIWRPLINVIDVAYAYCKIIESDFESDIFNLVYKNFRISELAHRVVHSMFKINSWWEGRIQINMDYDKPLDIRSYAISGEKIKEKLKIIPMIGIKETVQVFLHNFDEENDIDFGNPIYYNIDWIKMGVKFTEILKRNSNVFQEFIETEG